MMESIQVAVDLSESSPKTVEFAAKIAAANSVRLDLVHILVSAIPAQVKVHAPPGIREQMRSGEESRGRAQLTSLMGRCVPEETRGHCFLNSGEPATSVCELAGSGYGMVVISTHGRTGIEHVVLGSVAERIVRFATIPVRVVR
jgi:nucleotide-binding universal stress UspA family protein